MEAQTEALLERALTDRVFAVYTARRSPAGALDPTALFEEGRLAGTDHQQLPGVLGRGGTLHVFVDADPDRILRAVDIGPPADQKAQAADYRRFWGERSELRRFKDGQIAESVVWEANAGSRHTIPDRIIAYILERHLPEGASVSGAAGALDSALYPAASIGRPGAHDPISDQSVSLSRDRASEASTLTPCVPLPHVEPSGAGCYQGQAGQAAEGAGGTHALHPVNPADWKSRTPHSCIPAQAQPACRRLQGAEEPGRRVSIKRGAPACRL